MLRKFGLIVGLLCLFGCSEPTEEPYFSVDELHALITDGEREIIDECTGWMEAYEYYTELDDEDTRAAAESCLEKALDPVRALYTQSLEDDSPKGRRRSAAFATILAGYTRETFPGSCAGWIMRAADLGLIEAIHECQNPSTEELASYLLSPEDQAAWRAARQAEEQK